jgi:hypothetical protein
MADTDGVWTGPVYPLRNVGRVENIQQIWSWQYVYYTAQGPSVPWLRPSRRFLISHE